MRANIAIRATVEDYEAAYNKAIHKIESAYRLLEQAKEDLGVVSHYAMPSALTYQMPEISEVRGEISCHLWRQTFNATGLHQVMDAQARDEFERTLENNPPEYSVENVQATYLEMAAQADTLFQRGVVNVFRILSKNYRSHTNEPFVIPKKVILTGSVQPRFGGGMQWRFGRPTDRMNDIDRVIQTLDGNTHTPRSTESAMEAAWAYGEDYDDEYYNAKAFKNGNVHLTFKRADLLDKINDLIADYYGDRALAA